MDNFTNKNVKLQNKIYNLTLTFLKASLNTNLTLIKHTHLYVLVFAAVSHLFKRYILCAPKILNGPIQSIIKAVLHE